MANGLQALSGFGGAPFGGSLGDFPQQQQRQQPRRTGLGAFFLGQPEQTEQLSQYSPQNQEMFNQLIGQILGQYQTGGEFDPAGGGGFAPIAEQARTQFEEQTVPSIAERFTAMGGGGGRSSAFAQQLGQAGAGLEQGLAAQGAQFGLQQQGLLQNLLGMGRQESITRPELPGALRELFSSFTGGAGQSMPMLLKMLMGGG